MIAVEFMKLQGDLLAFAEHVKVLKQELFEIEC
jgi:hypothetical protein